MKPVRRIFLLLMAAVVLAMLAACGDSSPASSGEDMEVSREEVLTSLTDLVIVPRYGQAADAMKQLATSVGELCSAPDEVALETARGNWRLARDAWTTTEAYRFGPAMDRRSVSLVGWWPVVVERIDRTLADRKPVTTETVRQFMPSTQRGFAAMEHLLFGDGSGALALSQDGLRCGYLLALTEVAHEEIGGIHQEWKGDGQSPAYAAYFNGTGKLSLQPKEGEAEVVRSLVFMVRTIANMRLGAALAVDGEPDPEAIPSGMAGHSRDDLRNQVRGISEMYLGSKGDPEALGISHNVRQLSPEVDGRMAAAIEGVASAVEEVEGSLEAAIDGNPQPVRDVYDRFKELQRVLNTEVVSLLGVSVGFSDTDGDS